EMQIVFADVLKVENELRELEMKMSNSIEHDSPEFKALSSEYTKKQNFFDSRDGYQINVKIKTILNGLGFIDKDLNTVINTLSGGEKTRLAIARLLLEEPNLLILDEPTNHLDFKTLNWLEEYLLNYNGAILVVSHDRYFLDKIIDNVFELERRKVFTYKGNYSKYLVSKEERRVRYEKEYEAQQIQISGLQTYVDKNIARASTSASAKSRLKTLENMDILEKPNHDLKQIKLSFETIKESYKDVLTVNDLDVSVGDEHKIICKNISFEVKKGERIAIIGDNGIGKSSFFKTILSLIPHYKGDFFWGKNTSLSYYEQENLNLDPNNLAIDELWNRFPNIPEATIRKVLGNVLLTKEDVYKPVKVISGGERAKLAFCIIMLEKSNVILFDEPTNHLDLPSKEILEKALLKYDGTLIFISHDRYLLNKVPNKIIEIKNEGVIIYDGNFEYYKERSEMLKKIENQEKKIETSEKPKTSNYRSKEQRRAEVQMKNRIKEVELSINSIENEIQSLELELAKEEVYTDYILTGEKTQKLNDNNKLLEKLYEEWEELQEENDN
ncbi:MAG: ABC-F family ATP-binding cassette domain-containing protein, partial [Oscillospiraceae bacterium]